MARITDPHESDTTSNAQPSNGKTVLLAEDDPFISRMYQTKLLNAGFTVVMANNGRDAYEQIKASAPDLVILDINMPELSGFEVLRALQSDNSTFDTSKALILTNSSNSSDRQTAEAMGAAYMIKAEMTPKEVLDLITKKLGI